MAHLFIYDQLRSRPGDHSEAEYALGRTVLQNIPLSGFRMYNLELGPAVLPGSENDCIYGDLIQLSRGALLELDHQIMGFNPQQRDRSSFLRHSFVRTLKLGHPPIQFHLYLLNDRFFDLRTRPSEENRIHSGSWLDHLRSTAKK